MARRRYSIANLTPQELAELRGFSAPPAWGGQAHTDERREKERRQGKVTYSRHLRNTGRTLKVAFKMRPDVKAALAAAARKANMSETSAFERAVIAWVHGEGIDVAN
jgi:hypothetical protein